MNKKTEKYFTILMLIGITGMIVTNFFHTRGIRTRQYEILIAIDSLQPTDPNEQSTNAKTRILRLEIIGIEEDGWVEVQGDETQEHSDLLETAIADAILKGYITEEEADNLVADSREEHGNKTIVRYYKPTETTLE